MDWTEHVGNFIFGYPLFMSIAWSVGGIYYFLSREVRLKYDELPELTRMPLVSILIPARNEEACIERTITQLTKNLYPNLEVIVVNDASTDETFNILERISKTFTKLRILDLKTNMGKANGLNYAFLMSKGEIVVTIDADCLLDPHAIYHMVHHFNESPKTGAVTGNPRVLNRTNLVSQIQAAEYSSVIGLIKRAESIVGRLFTVSGVIVAFRKKALHDIGLWHTNMATDDIDITWRLQKNDWTVKYEARSLCWILVPEKVRLLWTQRKRWAQGGVEVLRVHKDVFKGLKNRSMWLVYLICTFSIIWAFTFFLCVILFVISSLLDVEIALAAYGDVFHLWKTSFLILASMFQFLVSILLDLKYDKTLWRTYIFIIWYPVFYWLIYCAACVVAAPKALFSKLDKTATWVSPERSE